MPAGSAAPGAGAHVPAVAVFSSMSQCVARVRGELLFGPYDTGAASQRDPAGRQRREPEEHRLLLAADHLLSAPPAPPSAILADMSVRTERSGSVTTVVLSRPDRRNAVDGPTAAALEQAFREFDADPDASVAVLWGEGGHFCGGADLKAFAAGESPNQLHLDAPADALGRPAPMGPTRLLLNKPVIAAISGYAVAGGLELALWCDLRVADADATLGVFCRRFGVPLIDGGTVRLPRIIGMGRALDLILTGRPVGADEAKAIGLVDRDVPPGDSRRAAEQLAREIAAFPQTCMRADRRSAYMQWDMSLGEALLAEAHGGLQAVSGEALAGARRFAGGHGRHGEFG